MSLKRFSRSTLILVGLLSGSVLAAVPVVESAPAATAAVAAVRSGPDAPETEAAAKVESGRSQPGGQGNSTAYFLNQVEALRQRNMVLEGRVEELEFQLKQNESEFRDRYLDLDARLNRLMNGATVLPEGNDDQDNTLKAGDTQPMELGAGISTEENQQQKREQEAYQAAVALIREREFDQALDALRAMLKDYPRGQYSANVQYWLGEVLMAQGQYEPARKEFQLVMEQYPESNKVPDASYKIGRLYDLLGDQASARKHLERVVSQFPGSSAARLSDTYLQTMAGS